MASGPVRARNAAQDSKLERKGDVLIKGSDLSVTTLVLCQPTPPLSDSNSSALTQQAAAAHCIPQLESHNGGQII